jgi:hypothetical protein
MRDRVYGPPEVSIARRSPDRLRDLLALVGTADNIPGVRGIGPRRPPSCSRARFWTASTRISTTSRRKAQSPIDSEADARISQTPVTLRTRPSETTAVAGVRGRRTERLRALFTELGFSVSLAAAPRGQGEDHDVKLRSRPCSELACSRPPPGARHAKQLLTRPHDQRRRNARRRVRPGAAH